MRPLTASIAVVLFTFGTAQSRAEAPTTQKEPNLSIDELIRDVHSSEAHADAVKKLDRAIEQNPRRPEWIRPLLKPLVQGRHAHAEYLHIVLYRMARGDQQQFNQHLPAIIALIDPKDSSKSFNAINLLLAIGPTAESAAEKLNEVVRNESSYNRFVRVRALGALARIEPADETHRNALLQHLDSKDRDVRTAAAAALGLLQTKNRDYVARLLKLADKDPSPATRVVAASSAYKLSGNAASVIPHLVTALKEEDAPVNINGIHMSSIRPGHRHVAIRTLASMEADAAPAVPVLAELVSDPDPFIRQTTIIALGEIGKIDETVRAKLERSLLDLVPPVREAAKSVLEKHPRDPD